MAKNVISQTMIASSYIRMHWEQLQSVTLIKTQDSESRGQEEAGRIYTRRMSVLFTGSTGVKFVDALNKPPLKLSLSYARTQHVLTI